MLRFFAATILFVWIGQMLPPLAMLAADESCQLSCCQGLSRHAAGSCEGGECHLHPKKRLQQPELICGGAELGQKLSSRSKQNQILFARDNRLENVPIFDETKNNSPEDAAKLPFLQTAFLEQSCQNFCGGACCSHNFSQQNQRADDRAALRSFAEKPRPPTTVRIEFSTVVIIKFSQIISRRAPARAPPVSFS